MVKMDLSAPENARFLPDPDRSWPVRKPVKGVPQTWRMDVPMDRVTPTPSERTDQQGGTPIGFWTELPVRDVVDLHSDHVFRSMKPSRKEVNTDRSMLGEIGRFLVLIYGLVIALYLIIIVNKAHP